MIKIGINGFGRIGRLICRELLNNKKYTLTSINHPTIDALDFHNMLKYDSVHGKFTMENYHRVNIHNHKEPKNIQWEEDLDVIIDTTGKFTEKEELLQHNKHSNTKIIVSAPSKTVPMFIYGINHKKYNDENIISASSCTTTCLAPIVKILSEHFTINSGLATTIHSITGSQQAVDKYKPNSRLGRSLLNNIIPSSTGAAKSIGKIIPELDGKLDAIGIRVPIQNVSLLDLNINLDTNMDLEYILDLFTEASMLKYKGIIEVNNDLLVSSDFIGKKVHSIIDSSSCKQINNIYKIMAWYDNEIGYINQLLQMLDYIVDKNDYYF